MEDILQKDYLKKIRKQLRDSPWVYSPVFEDVKSILAKINASESYFERGCQKATREFQKMESYHRSWVSSMVNMEDFPYCYFVNGATEAINQWRLSDTRPWQYLPGEYEWPRIISKNGIERNLDQLDCNRVLYLSDPSSVDGDFLSNKTLKKIYDLGCPVILDCAYIGAVKKKSIPLGKSVEKVFFSFSKGWGLVGQRAGLIYSRKPINSFEYLKKVECWNYQTIQVICQIMKSYNVDTMYERNFSRQTEICSRLKLKTSDTYFIGQSADSYFIKRVRATGSKARLCLTPIWFDNLDELDTF